MRPILLILLLLVYEASSVSVIPYYQYVADEDDGNSHYHFVSDVELNGTHAYLFAGGARFACDIAFGHTVNCTLIQTCWDTFGCDYDTIYQPTLVEITNGLQCVNQSGLGAPRIAFIKLDSVLVIPNILDTPIFTVVFEVIPTYLGLNSTIARTLTPQLDHNLGLDLQIPGLYCVGTDVGRIDVSLHFGCTGTTPLPGTYPMIFHYMNGALASLPAMVMDPPVLTIPANPPALLILGNPICSTQCTVIPGVQMDLSFEERGYDSSDFYASTLRREMQLFVNTTEIIDITGECGKDISQMESLGIVLWFCHITSVPEAFDNITFQVKLQ